jgi:hypothetical protein
MPGLAAERRYGRVRCLIYPIEGAATLTLCRHCTGRTR